MEVRTRTIYHTPSTAMTDASSQLFLLHNAGNFHDSLHERLDRSPALAPQDFRPWFHLRMEKRKAADSIRRDTIHARLGTLQSPPTIPLPCLI